MKVTRQTSTTAEAVQWLGTSQSLQEIQQLLAPASPCYDGDFDQKLEYRSLGVMVNTAHLQSTRLEHVSPPGWVVKDGEVVMVMTDEQFRRSYTAEDAYTSAPQADQNDPRFPAIRATHPRALASVADPRD